MLKYKESYHCVARNDPRAYTYSMLHSEANGHSSIFDFCLLNAVALVNVKLIDLAVCSNLTCRRRSVRLFRQVKPTKVTSSFRAGRAEICRFRYPIMVCVIRLHDAGLLRT
jgi:hypothetical protein